MMNDFVGLIKRLSNEGVDFVLIGGFAGVVYGCSLVTQDIDVCCDFSVENLIRLQKAVADLHPKHRMASKCLPLELTDESCKSFKNLYLETDMGQLDCLSYVEGIGNFQAVDEVSRFIEMEGVKLKILQIESLIESKKALGRPHDKEAVVRLEAIEKVDRTKSNQ